MKINVKEISTLGEIQVGLTDVKFDCNNIGIAGLLFWLTPDDANKLRFQIESLLQDMDIRKEEK